MTQRNPDCYHLSASAINAFKACPTRFRLAYREGLRLDTDTEAQRMGTNWHALHEVYNQTLRRLSTCSCPPAGHDEGCWACVAGPDAVQEAARAAAVEHLNVRYAKVPLNKTPEEWDTERLILLVSFNVYLWYWSNDPVESIIEEVAFDLPVHHPKTGLPLPISEVMRVGKIDTVCRWRGMVGNREMKSTSSSIGDGDKYWERSAKDTQVSMYALAFRDMQEHGLENYGITLKEGDRLGNTLYDVWRKPKSKPKALTQAATKELIETGKYYDQEFAVEAEWDTETTTVGKGSRARTATTKTLKSLKIDGAPVSIKLGKKAANVETETPRMFACRLQHEMMENPGDYFVRKEIPRTDRDLARFRVELYRIYQAMKAVAKGGAWFENENQCRALWTCAYVPICYGSGADEVCDSGSTPQGFKRIFDITVEGEALNDEQD